MSADKQAHIVAPEHAQLEKKDGSIICEGYLEKEGGKKMAKKWQTRWFVLQGPMLSYYHGQTKCQFFFFFLFFCSIFYAEKGDLQAAGVVPVGNCTVALADENLVTRKEANVFFGSNMF